jgi:serine/threonine-protein kinase
MTRVEPPVAYQSIFELGKGGMGTVYLAREVGRSESEGLVVVKRLNRELTNSAEAMGRFLDEARYAALIDHENVVGVRGTGHDEEGFFLVLDYVEGASLEELVDRTALKAQKMPPSTVLRVALDILRGLAAAHDVVDASGRRLDLLHRDVSPPNVLVGRDGITRLTDFGIARSAFGSVSTDRKHIVGKLLYSPPEYLRQRAAGPPLDVYALGMTMWIALSGSEPWPEATEAQLVTRILRDGVPRLTATGLGVAPQIDALVSRACARERSQRFPSARDMAEAIETIERETGQVATHSEVAEYVELLVGADLSRRRTLIESVLAASS